MIHYLDDSNGIQVTELGEGFFEGWPDPPSPETHVRILQGSDAVVLAVDEESEKVVGFITAITDGILSAYIPLLEVLPEYRGRGIGKELVRRMLDHFHDLNMVDLMCDPEIQPFYASVGMTLSVGMVHAVSRVSVGWWPETLILSCCASQPGASFPCLHSWVRSFYISRSSSVATAR